MAYPKNRYLYLSTLRQFLSRQTLSLKLKNSDSVRGLGTKEMVRQGFRIKSCVQHLDIYTRLMLTVGERISEKLSFLFRFVPYNNGQEQKALEVPNHLAFVSFKYEKSFTLLKI